MRNTPQLHASIALVLLQIFGCTNIETVDEGTPTQDAEVPEDAPELVTEKSSEHGAVVRTETGRVRGRVSRNNRTFHGIPFAAPPVGALRWQPPRPPLPWTGVRDATARSPRCAQSADAVAGTPASLDEDCLYLDVTTPRSPGRLRPVMVWIHGGGLRSGSGSDLDELRLSAAGDVVVVSINYRLGIFGFLGLPGLEGAATFGLQDQQAALSWVERNIRAFGGDPENVTVFGLSAGADSICAQLTSPAARGLFDKAVLQSSPCTQEDGPNLIFATLDPAYDTWKPLTLAEDIGVDVAARLGCSDPGAVLACLRELPVDKLLGATSSAGIEPYWSPAYGTPILPEHPGQAVRAGRFHRVPILQGVTHDEGTFFTAAGGYTWITPELYPVLLEAAFGSKAPLVEATYPLSQYVSPSHAWSALITDGAFACTSLASNAELARHVPTFAYEFADRDAPLIFDLAAEYPLGAYHGADIPYLHGTVNRRVELTPAQKRLSEQMIAYVASFARRGDPNGPGLPEWPQFRSSRPHVQKLSPGPQGIGPSETFVEHHCALWSSLE